MVSSFLFYWFILLPIILPATKPSTEEAKARVKSWRDIHNLSLFVYSAFCCGATAASLYADGQLFDWHALLCTPVEGTWVRFLSATFTFSKLVEWIDTAFLVWLGSSPPLFLHKYHHATTFWLFCIVMNMPGRLFFQHQQNLPGLLSRAHFNRPRHPLRRPREVWPVDERWRSHDDVQVSFG